MMGVAEFIARNYYEDDTPQGVERVRSLLSNPGIHFMGTPDAGLILVYMLLSDEGLDLLRSKKDTSEFTREFSRELLSYPGDNVYVFRLVSEERPRLLALRQMRERIIKKHNARTFSWHDNDRVLLHTYEVA